MREILVRLSLVLAAAWLAVGTTAQASATSWQDYAPDASECGFLDIVNAYRADHGLHALKLSATLGAAAEHHSLDMARHDYFSHTLADGTDWHKNILDHRYLREPATAENIAAGRSSARGAFALWANSPGHDANMLDPDMWAIGIGRAYDADSRYGWYWTTTFGARSSRIITC